MSKFTNKNESDFYVDSGYELDENSHDQDFMLALQLQMQIENEDQIDKDSNDKHLKTLGDYHFENKTDKLSDPQFELIDPCPDIRALFIEFDKKYFWNTLGSCIVEWSKRMTICAGIFYLREGGIIRLSEPLLKFRPRKDLIDTLLHEMIHAYLYLTRNFKDRGEHGDEFKGHMNRINKQANTTITVYHSFHDEVNFQRQHIWRCNGPCRTCPPFYGYVKRSMNRAPGKNDTWWSQHQSKCNGTFEKVSEPESYKEKSNKSKLNNSKSSKIESKDKKKIISSSKQPSGIKTLDSYLNFSSNSILKAKSESEILNKTNSEINYPISSSQTQLINNYELKQNLIKIDNYFQVDTNTDTSFQSQLSLIKKRKSSEDEDSSFLECKRSNFLPRPNQTENDDIVCVGVKKTNLNKNDHDLIILTESPKVPIEKNYSSSFTDEVVFEKEIDLVECPVCFNKLSQNLINNHVNNHFN